jgi:hypothetical protein
MTSVILATLLVGGQYAAPLKPGTVAPKWTAKTPEGPSLSLTAALKGKKALLVNFWFYT